MNSGARNSKLAIETKMEQILEVKNEVINLVPWEIEKNDQSLENNRQQSHELFSIF